MTLAALCLAIAVAAAVQLVSGFGFALVAAPVLVALTDPVTSVSVLAVLGVVISALALTTGREPREVRAREALGLLAWALPGIVAGALVIDRVDEDLVRASVGVLVLAALAQRRRAARGASMLAEGAVPEVPAPRARRVRGGAGLAAAGLASGAMTTSTGLNGPPLVLYLTAHRVAPRAARDTLAVLFLVLDIVGVVALAGTGNLELPTETLALPVAALAGVLLGHAVFDRLTDAARTSAITAMLVAAALTALGAAVG